MEQIERIKPPDGLRAPDRGSLFTGLLKAVTTALSGPSERMMGNH